MLAESKFRSKFKSKFTSRFDRGLLMAGTVMASRSRLPHWVTLGASADFDFIGERYSVEGLAPAFTDIPGETSSGGVNGTVVRDGVIVAATEQNLLTYSEDLTNAAWSGTSSAETVTPNDREAPDGTTTADKITASLGANRGVVQSPINVVSGIASKTFTASIWVYAESDFDFDIRIRGSGTTQEPENLTVSTASGQWKRVSVTKSFTAAADGNDLLLAIYTSTFNTSNENAFWIWGAQLREARYSDTYVPTTSAAITRAAPRIGDDGLLVEGAATNKCEAFAAPNDTTGLTKTGDAAATLTVVNDSVALAAAGLAEITGGKAYKLDNTAGSGSAFANVIGAVGNLNTHTASAYIRASDSSGRIGVGGSTSGATTSYTRLTHTQTPSSTLNTCYIAVNAGAVVYFVLPQLEEGSTATSYIPTEGSSVTRTADSVTLATADLGLADDETFNVEYDDGTTGTISAVSGTLTIPANAKAYARIWA